MPIHKAIENFLIFQIPYHVGVIRECFGYFERPDPQGFKFFVLAFILFRSIPFQYQVSYLKLFLLGLLIKNLLDPLLMVLNSAHYLLSGLLDLH
jgi:hypothetical protein